MGQFTGLLNELDTAATKPQPKAKANNTAKRSPQKQAAATEEAPAKALPTSKGKPANGKAATAAPMRGKRSHPDYTQAPAFVRKDTYKAIKIALLNDERGLDYSDLVEELLTAWLTKKK
jgi:hypothetical protein